MKNVVFALLLSFSIGQATAQTKPYRVPFSGQGKKVHVIIQHASVDIQGYDGSDVVLEDTGENKRELPKEAEGLRLFTDGVVDNTGLGANVEAEGNTLKITIPKNKYTGIISLKVPRNLNLLVTESQSWSSGKLSISNMSGEIEVKTYSSRLMLNDITGPLVAHNQSGRIYVTYSKLNQSSPSSISARDAIDITLPADTKADLKIKSFYGDLFTDLDIVKVKKEVKEGTTVAGKSGSGQIQATTGAAAEEIAHGKAFTYNKDCQDCPPTGKFTIAGTSSRGSDNFEGTINGGGVSIDLRSTNGNIYVRKKK